MKGGEFSTKVNNQEITNGTKFNVFNLESKKIGIVGVIDTTIVFVEMSTIPNDLYSDNYTFEEIISKVEK